MRAMFGTPVRHIIAEHRRRSRPRAASRPISFVPLYLTSTRHDNLLIDDSHITRSVLSSIVTTTLRRWREPNIMHAIVKLRSRASLASLCPGWVGPWNSGSPMSTAFCPMKMAEAHTSWSRQKKTNWMYGSIKYFRASRNVVGALVLRSVEDLMIRSFVLLVLFLFFFHPFSFFGLSLGLQSRCKSDPWSRSLTPPLLRALPVSYGVHSSFDV